TGLLAAGIAAANATGAVAERREAKQEKQATGKQEPSTLAVSIPWQWLASSGGTMNFQCDSNRPPNDEGVKMVEALSRAGSQSRFAGKSDDGGTFTGTRKGDDFTFETVSKDGSKFVPQMPWLAARCIFGGAKPAGATSVELRARDIGGRLRLEVAGQTKGVRVEVKK
ncbi:MAG: hypothetical protein M3R62_15330, partial [Acidobacteriota bacterium]|nr:hypothetical protein [Acidobacteriota bacterium]